MIRRKSGVTLLEVIVVVFIMVVLVALLLPAVNAARETARRLNCQNNLKQMTLGIHAFEARTSFLPYYEGRLEVVIHRQFALLPDLEQTNLYNKTKKEIDDLMNWNTLSGYRTRVPVFECPSDAQAGFLAIHQLSGEVFAPSSYVGIVGKTLADNDGAFPSRYGVSGLKTIRVRMSDVSDGLSNTLCLGERVLAREPLVGAWLSSQEYGHEALALFGEISMGLYGNCSKQSFSRGNLDRFCDQFYPWSNHGNGANFAMLDGAVNFLSYSTNKDILIRLSTRAAND